MIETSRNMEAQDSTKMVLGVRVTSSNFIATQAFKDNKEFENFERLKKKTDFKLAKKLIFQFTISFIKFSNSKIFVGIFNNHTSLLMKRFN